MTTEGEQQEAVCGTCGGRIRRVGVGINPGTLRGVLACENGHTIPAPVVPSDELCAVHVDSDGERPITCLHVEDVHVDGVCQTCERYLEPGAHHAFAAAPPTPSQDAEGDGLDALWEAFCRALFEGSADDEKRTRAEVESAIREPYEALMKAVGLFIRRATAEECFGCGAPIHHGAGHEAGCAVVSLYVALESLGGRKDG